MMFDKFTKVRVLESIHVTILIHQIWVMETITAKINTNLRNIETIGLKSL